MQISYNRIGSSVDADGFLVEPFWMIPIGFVGMVAVSLTRVIKAQLIT